MHARRDVGKGCITAELIDPDELVAGIITRAAVPLNVHSSPAAVDAELLELSYVVCHAVWHSLQAAGPPPTLCTRSLLRLHRSYSLRILLRHQLCTCAPQMVCLCVNLQEDGMEKMRN